RTDSAIGRLIVQILAAFSEFEREMIVERTRDKMRAAKRKGKFCGGMVPLGYDIDPTTKRLVINAEEAEIVREIFRMYLETGRTAEIRKAAQQRGWTVKTWVTKDGQQRKGIPLSYGVLATMLRNPVYVGKVRAGDDLVAGEHEAIIDEATFARADAIAAARHQFRDDAHFFRRNPQALLKGLLTCGKCGALMTHTSSHKRQDGKRYRHYRCLTTLKQGREACPSLYVPAQEIEGFIVDHLQRLADEPAQIAQMVQSVIAHRSVRLPQIAEEISQAESRIARASQTIERLRHALESGEEGETTRAFERIHAREQEITEAQDARTALEQEQAELEHSAITDTAFHYALTLVKDTWPLITFPERLALLRRILKKVTYNTESGKLDVDFNLTGICTLHDEHTQAEENNQ
ncbi:MAG TPA: recombinase zinc beta ribbon domain-containing protein, partial [Armatimonadota bacterium]|nr:recombinase zinc beta ribbon domain-containing protein [Armatimonadota bacterium]